MFGCDAEKRHVSYYNRKASGFQPDFAVVSALGKEFCSGLGRLIELAHPVFHEGLKYEILNLVVIFKSVIAVGADLKVLNVEL